MLFYGGKLVRSGPNSTKLKALAIYQKTAVDKTLPHSTAPLRIGLWAGPQNRTQEVAGSNPLVSTIQIKEFRTAHLPPAHQ